MVIEENTWLSQKIAASIVAILAEEILGYRVVFNPVSPLELLLRPSGREWEQVIFLNSV